MGHPAERRYALSEEKMLESQRIMNLEHRYYHRSYMRTICLAVVLVATPYLLVCLLYTQTLHLPRVLDVVRTATAHNPVRVPLEAHIMSKCPDAKDCLNDLVVPAMEKVYDKVDFKLSYIGTCVVYHSALDTWLCLQCSQVISIESDGGITCKHGQSECLGNILELCAADIYPDPKIHLGFTMCMTEDYQEIPSRDLAQDCALEHGIDFDKLNDCISEEGKGMDLLEASVQRSIDKDVKYSCTVRLNDTVRCIRDNGEWKDCDGGSSVEDLVKDVERIYNASGTGGI